MDNDVIEPAIVEKNAMYITLISAGFMLSGMQRTSDALVIPNNRDEAIYKFSQFWMLKRLKFFFWSTKYCWAIRIRLPAIRLMVMIQISNGAPADT